VQIFFYFPAVARPGASPSRASSVCDFWWTRRRSLTAAVSRQSVMGQPIWMGRVGNGSVRMTH